jgi:hypothetical protein
MTARWEAMSRITTCFGASEPSLSISFPPWQYTLRARFGPLYRLMYYS